MDLEGNLKREINQKRQIRFTCVWNIKNTTNWCLKQRGRLTDIENKLVAASREKEGGGTIRR